MEQSYQSVGDKLEEFDRVINDISTQCPDFGSILYKNVLASYGDANTSEFWEHDKLMTLPGTAGISQALEASFRESNLYDDGDWYNGLTWNNSDTFEKIAIEKWLIDIPEQS